MKPVSKTAFYTAGVRMLDTKVKRPICNDTLAHVFMNETGMEILNKTRHLLGPRITTVQRHKIIDDVLRDMLHKNPKAKIFLIGAGFDTRAYRLQGGIWTELDEPEVIAYKEEKLPQATSPNPLQRIAIQFAAESLAEKLNQFKTDEEVIVIYEGVFMYLTEELIAANMRIIRKIFPNHFLICDLLTRKFFNRFSKKLHKELSDMGAFFQFKHHDKPQDFFTETGYRQLQQISVAQTGVDAGNLVIPKLIYFFFKNTFKTGYTINVFKCGL
jgi:methyltransferase (TIGR00027 family)